MRGGASLHMTVQAERRALLPGTSRAQLRRWARCALTQDAELTLRFVGRSEARKLNGAYRGAGYVPNVLTFCYDEPSGDERSGDEPFVAETPIRADIVICMPVVRAQAAAQRKTVRDHLAHMVIHGVLHAQHWDHRTREQARRMEAREVRLLRSQRIPDPY